MNVYMQTTVHQRVSTFKTLHIRKDYYRPLYEYKYMSFDAIDLFENSVIFADRTSWKSKAPMQP